MKENVTETIAERLKKERMKHHLTQKQMAEKLDISESGYRKLEKGVVPMSQHVLEKLNSEMGVSADYILFGEKDTETAILERFRILSLEQRIKVITSIYEDAYNI
jgi:transcriptional regulator with XRE-family HTH domain